MNIKLSKPDLKEIINEHFNKLFYKANFNENTITVWTNNKEFVSFSIDNLWEEYNKEFNLECVALFIKRKTGEIATSITNQERYEEAKLNILPVIRSDEFLDKLSGDVVTFSRKFISDLNVVLVKDGAKYTELLTEKSYSDLPEESTIYKQSFDNYVKAGWVDPCRVYETDSFKMSFFVEDERNIHWQLINKEWMEKKYSDCYIGFPTHKIAVVLEIKTTNWEEWVSSMKYFKKTVNDLYRNERLPLSKEILRFTDKEYQII